MWFNIVMKLTELSCDQVYNIWSTDPDQLLLLDLRDSQSYEKSHIPGSHNISTVDIEKQVQANPEKLCVLVTAEKNYSQFEFFNLHTNIVIMSDCKSWILKNPVVGSDVTFENFKESHFAKRSSSVSKQIIFHQLYEHETSTYTYLIADQKTKEAALIDPVIETIERDLKLIQELGLKLVYVLDTHIHADHITGAGEIRKRTQAKTAVSASAEVPCVDIPLEDGQELFLGDHKITAISTPGHTNTCMTYLFDDMAFTGDSLMIRGCGRTDFQQGSPEKMFQSVREKLFKLPDDTIIYPGHDYRGNTSSTVGQEKQFNARLKTSISKEEFAKIMTELKLAQPKKIHEAVPANLSCGIVSHKKVLQAQNVDGIPEVSVEDVFMHLQAVKDKKLKLIDVRRAEEFNAELGHIPGATLVTLGESFSNYLSKEDKSAEIVFVCRSGGRSGQATAESVRLGFKNTANMVGGMLQWNEKKQIVERT